MKYESTLLPQTNEPAEIQKALLDLLSKINSESLSGLSAIEPSQIANDDMLVVWDTSAMAYKKIAFSDFIVALTG